ncbi:MAG: hypothetical protein M3P26_18115 [Gemmatimonadota bacterium]|nr:hypothetical protein [Gemmatimonadota bacterium]
MVRLPLIRFFALTLASVAALSCADNQSPVAPSAPTGVEAGLKVEDTTVKVAKLPKTDTTKLDATLYPAGYKVTAVQWGSGHVASQSSASATIGLAGGTISVPGADFSIRFPAGAVAKATVITIVAMDGRYVSYDMFPHGLKFKVPVFATQRFLNTTLYDAPSAAQTAQGAYLPDGNETISKAGTATTTEKLKSMTVWILQGLLWVPESQTWELKHFSRYILASG